MRKVFFFSALFLISACGNQSSTNVSAVKQDSIHWRDSLPEKNTTATNDFIAALKEINISNINQYIHPEKGLWLIQSSGAMPDMTNIAHVDKNFPVDFSNVKAEELPKVNCDTKSFWTKKGCFAQEINSFKDEKIWTYCGLSKEDEAKVSELAQKIQLTIINTSLNARYYFSLIDGRLYLAFVDLRKPCEA